MDAGRTRAGVARSFLEGALAGPAHPGKLLLITLPAPRARMECLLQVGSRLYPPAEGLHGVLWHPPSGPALAGIGAAWQVLLRGVGRLDELRAQARSLFGRLVLRSAPLVQAPRPRLLGGLAFAAGGSGEPPWLPFGDGRFVLPRWCYRRDGSAASLTLALGGEALSDPGERERALGELTAILRALDRDRDGDGDHAGPIAPVADDQGPAQVTQLEQARWSAQVGAICQAIAAGRFEKIVAARRCLALLPRPISDTGVLARLGGEHPECTRFAFRAGAATFVGATPERLIKRHGARLQTEALAGSIACAAERDDDHAGEALLGSDKDHGEHALVVREVLRALRPLCAELLLPPVPSLRRLRHVLHLHTPITGRLRAPLHILDLLSVLHPTPAVGGVPAEDALRWIVEHEPPRGWYAGPVGWFDAAGDGEFMVALRCGVLAEKEAYVYAGAGIVRGSDAAAEYAETALKQRALLGALGVA